MSRPGGKLWAGSDDESSASENEVAVDMGADQKRQQKRWEVDSDSGMCVCRGDVCVPLCLVPRRIRRTKRSPLIQTATFTA